MKIVIERKIGIGLYGFFGQVAQYREAPLHQIFLQTIIDQPGVTLEELVRIFGLPPPACRQVLRPLESAGLLATIAPTANPTLMATTTMPAEKKLPIVLLEGDWLALIADQPFYGQQILGVMPASRFNFPPRTVMSVPEIESLQGQSFTCVGSYEYQQGDKPDARGQGSFSQGMLLTLNPGAVARLDNFDGMVSQDAKGSTLSLHCKQPGLSVDLKLHSNEVRPDIEALGLAAIRRHNSRTGAKHGAEPILRKSFESMKDDEKKTARGAIYEEIGDDIVKIDDLRVLPADQPSYEAWVGFGFEQRLRGYAQPALLTRYLAESIAFIGAQGFMKPRLPQVILRLRGKSKLYASAMADWPGIKA